MATYQITTKRSDLTEVSVVTRHRVDAARQCHAAIVWASCAGHRCSIGQSRIVWSTRRGAPTPVIQPSSRNSRSLSLVFRSHHG